MISWQVFRISRNKMESQEMVWKYQKTVLMTDEDPKLGIFV